MHPRFEGGHWTYKNEDETCGFLAKLIDKIIGLREASHKKNVLESINVLLKITDFKTQVIKQSNEY